MYAFSFVWTVTYALTIAAQQQPNQVGGNYQQNGAPIMGAVPNLIPQNQPQFVNQPPQVGNQQQNQPQLVNQQPQVGNQPPVYVPPQNQIHEGAAQQQAAFAPQEQPRGANAAKKIGAHFNLIAESKECGEDIKRICPESMLGSNYHVLTCLAQQKDDTDLTDECHTYIWDYKRQMSNDKKFTQLLETHCQDEIDGIIKAKTCGTEAEVKANVLSCLLMHKVDKQEGKSKCKNMLSRVSLIVFSDYRLISGFYDKCKDDVTKLQCGSITFDQNAQHSQGETIECLMQNFKKVSPECKVEVQLVAELQAEDFHLDRALYFACKADREVLCSDVAAGEGRVYNCLFEKKSDPSMSPSCQDALSTRQKLMVEDPKVNYLLKEACYSDLERFRGQCNYDEMVKNEHSHMASMLMCLEDKQRKGKPLSSQCVGEMKKMRKMLMSDYEMNPRIVKYCGEIISERCNGMEKGGKTLHCLMKLGMTATPDFDMKTSNPQCFDSIEYLIRSVNPIEDISTDAVLLEACKPVLDANCRNKQGRGYVSDPVGCLFAKVEDESMTDDCAEVLLEISYFASRDWALDRKLLRACYPDAKEKCQADKWGTNLDKSPVGEVFACLYRHINHDDNSVKLRETCAVEVVRVMRERAVAVGLNPHLEMVCRADLAQYCSDEETTSKRQELQCLQDLYSVGDRSGPDGKKLSPQCHKTMKDYIEVEMDEVQINRKFFDSCKPMVIKYCQEESQVKDSAMRSKGRLLECMIKHKNEPDVNPICLAGIEHMQLVQLKDFDFDVKFRRACKADVISHCPNTATKDEVVSCLSIQIRNDVVQGKEPSISEECQAALKRPLAERYEDIKLDTKFFEECKEDAQRLCSNVRSGGGRVLECLKENRDELSPKCKAKLFKREEIEFSDPGAVQEKDFLLNRMCKNMIQEYCEDEENVLRCLWKHRNEPDFDARCMKVVHKRMIAKGEDIRLNPQLLKACKADIKDKCSEEMNKLTEDGNQPRTPEEYQGIVLQCLRKQYTENTLSEKCSVQVKQFIRVSAQEWKSDVRLKLKCGDVVKRLCSDRSEGRVEECLKDMLMEDKITDEMDPKQQCRKEVARLLEEGSVDIQGDPILQKTCSLDIEHHCANVAPGNRRQITCLIEKLKENPAKIKTDCRKMLEDRRSMWSKAGTQMQQLESIGQLMVNIGDSPNRHYFLTIFGLLVSVIFFGGLLFGRVTKRVAREMKSR